MQCFCSMKYYWNAVFLLRSYQSVVCLLDKVLLDCSVSALLGTIRVTCVCSKSYDWSVVCLLYDVVRGTIGVLPVWPMRYNLRSVSAL